MEIRLFDVEHGDCIFIESLQGEVILVDCGYNRTTGWRPSTGLAQQGFGEGRRLHHLIITHPDQDHLADLPGVLTMLKPVHVWQHPQLSLQNLGELKATLSQAQAAYVARSKSMAELQPIEASRQFKTLELRQFYLPLGAVRNINDHSLLTFIKEPESGFTICLPGDLTAVGWRKHLQNKAVRYWLRETNLFVASHHGRVSGYCKELFAKPGPTEPALLSPKLIVISDKEQTKGRTVVQRAPYRDHAYGVKLPDGSWRKVLTTRGDGRIRIVVKGREWQVETSRAAPPASLSRYTHNPTQP